jgi:hypothetical protein
MQGVGDRTVPEIDGRSADDATGLIHTQARATVAVEEREPELAFVFVDPAFAGARRRS